MSLDELEARIDEIFRTAKWGGGPYWDDSLAHELEDQLFRELLFEYLPEELYDELKRLLKADFTRYTE